MHGRGHAWQGVCMAGGHAWQGMCGRRTCMTGVHGRGHARQGVVHSQRGAWSGGVHGSIDGHCSGRYASYRNPLLLLLWFR